jgi:type III secretory pathway component EscT
LDRLCRALIPLASFTTRTAHYRKCLGAFLIIIFFPGITNTHKIIINILNGSYLFIHIKNKFKKKKYFLPM